VAFGQSLVEVELQSGAKQEARSGIAVDRGWRNGGVFAATGKRQPRRPRRGRGSRRSVGEGREGRVGRRTTRSNGDGM